MRPLSTPQFIAKRFADNWQLLLSVFVGITIAAALVSGAPVYIKSLGRVGFLSTLEKSSALALNILTISPDVPIDRDGLTRVETSVEEAFQSNISSIYAGRDRYIKTDTVLLNPTPIFPSIRLALVQEPDALFDEDLEAPSLGYFMNSQSLDDHVNVVRGRMPGSVLTERPPPGRTTIVEAAIGLKLADSLDMDVGDELLLNAISNTRTRAIARIVGVIEPINPSEVYWQERASLFFDPSFPQDIPELAVEVDRKRPIAAFIIAPEAASKLPDELVELSRYRTLSAYFATATGLDKHVKLIEGRSPGDHVSAGPRGPIVEAMVGAKLAESLDVHLGDVISLTPFIDEPVWMSAHIVGIAERTDPDDPYWLWGPNSFFLHTIPNEPVQLAVLITREAMVAGVAEAYPGTLGKLAWYAAIDAEGFKDWTAEETRLRLKNLEGDLAVALPGQLTSTGIDRLVAGFERRILIGSVPLLLLMTTMVVTVLYFVSMMVSYLVQSRERDVALLKTRGISTPQIFKLYGLEGLAVTVMAVAVAPFLALGAIALAGRLPHFNGMTGGDFLPVRIELVPFLVAAGVGILCLFIFVAPSVIGARAGLLAHKLRSSRPPVIPFFQRYYLDIGLLIVGGIIFWELQTRGNLVAGGLFEDVEVNETLLLAPVVFMIVVALLFMRFFPLVLKFLSGESPALLHTLVVATTVVLGSVITVRELLDGNMASWIIPVALLSAFASVYTARTRAHVTQWRFWGLVIQIPIVAAFVIVEPLDSAGVLAVPTVALILVVPAQVVFQLLQSYARIAPVWVSLALWRMARNPLQYTWLVLLLVLVAGLAAFSNTVGTTLNNRDEARILYGVAADARVTISTQANGWALKDKYSAIPGVDRVSPAYRARGSTVLSSSSFDILAVNAKEFADISWYRQDFSDQDLGGIMRELHSQASPNPIAIPSGSAEIGVWSKLGQSASGISVRMVIQDATRAMRILPLGDVGPDWKPVRAELPSDLIPPLNLIAVQVLTEKGAIGATNSVILDDIHVTIGTTEAVDVLDDFEGDITWHPLPTAFDESTSVIATTADAHRGARAVMYKFGHQILPTVAGIYQNPSGGPLPVVVSRTFADTLDIEVGGTFMASIDNRLVQMEIRDTVRYFPTMEGRANGFLIADFDQLIQHMNVRQPESATTPNELFIALDSDAGPEVSAQIRGLSRLGIRVLDRESISESFELDPLITAGWRAVALVSLAVVVFTSLTGIVTYLLFFSDDNRGEMSVIRGLGFTQRQMIGLLAIEHLLIAVIGMGLGTWAGLRMSSMMVPLVSLAESGGDVALPIVATTNWLTISFLYAIVTVTFVVMLIILNRGVFQRNMAAASRIGN
jgi:ABC-type lipoprotein release transport system permease subunit